MFKTVAVFGTIALLVGPAMAAEPTLSALIPIPLHTGANMIPAFTPDGHTGLIAMGWRPGAPDAGYDLAMVMLQTPSGGWSVIQIEPASSDPNGEENDTVQDQPAAGHDMVSAFRFARGDVDGKPATLLLEADRVRATINPASPSGVTFDAYEYEAPDRFVPIREDQDDNPVCNADVALAEHFGLPLREKNLPSEPPGTC